MFLSVREPAYMVLWLSINIKYPLYRYNKLEIIFLKYLNE